MIRRESRLKEARVNAQRCTRDLQRDRSELERQERILVSLLLLLLFIEHIINYFVRCKKLKSTH